MNAATITTPAHWRARCEVCQDPAVPYNEDGQLETHRAGPAERPCAGSGKQVTRGARSTIREVSLLGRAHGFYVTETDCRDIDGTLTVDLDGHGDLLEIVFRRTATGYWGFHHSFMHNNYGGGDRWYTLTRTRCWIDARPAGTHYRYDD